jgi:hypothetical protein
MDWIVKESLATERIWMNGGSAQHSEEGTLPGPGFHKIGVGHRQGRTCQLPEKDASPKSPVLAAMGGAWIMPRFC